MDYSLPYSSRTGLITRVTCLLPDYEQQRLLCITDLLLLPFYFSSFLPRYSPAYGAWTCSPSILLSSTIGNSHIPVHFLPLPHLHSDETVIFHCLWANQVLIHFLFYFFPSLHCASILVIVPTLGNSNLHYYFFIYIKVVTGGFRGVVHGT